MMGLHDATLGLDVPLVTYGIFWPESRLFAFPQGQTSQQDGNDLGH